MRLWRWSNEIKRIYKDKHKICLVVLMDFYYFILAPLLICFRIWQKTFPESPQRIFPRKLEKCTAKMRKRKLKKTKEKKQTKHETVFGYVVYLKPKCYYVKPATNSIQQESFFFFLLLIQKKEKKLFLWLKSLYLFGKRDLFILSWIFFTAFFWPDRSYLAFHYYFKNIIFFSPTHALYLNDDTS